MKALLALVGALLALLLLDRGGALLAERAIAAQAQAAAQLAQRPQVDVAGFPFLTQALGGRYERVELRAADVPAGQLRLAQLTATLTGVQLPLSDALSGAVDRVPVERVAARALLPYAQLAPNLRVEPVGQRVRVSGQVEVLGQSLSAAAVSRVEVVDGAVVVSAQEFEVAGRTLNRALTRALREVLDLRIAVTGLPYGLQVTGVDVRPDGLQVRAAATGTTVS